MMEKFILRTGETLLVQNTYTYDEEEHKTYWDALLGLEDGVFQRVVVSEGFIEKARRKVR